MPFTYNGVGTHYYGRKNVQSRPGTCPHCGRSVQLVSYDTGLWFVVVFIPVIPLGRKRIIDMCSSCRRHYVMPLHKWETARQLEVSGAMEKFRSDPTPDAAIEAHRKMLIYQQVAEADELQKLLAEKFQDNVRVQCYLAAALTQLGRISEANAFFARALELRPDLPEARVGVAAGLVRAQRLDDARRLLDFLEKPGAAQLYSLGPIEDLAIAYQKTGRHKEALELFGRLLAELPNIGQHGGFRKLVKQSEAALKQGPTILPKGKFSLRRWLQQAPSGGAPSASISPKALLIGLGAVAIVGLVAAVIANEHIRRHRTLYIVSSFGPSLKLEVSGLGKVNVRRGLTEVTLKEGHYEARFSGDIQENVSLDIRSTYFGRWFDHPVWILNPGGESLLLVQRAVYMRNPQPVQYSYRFGRSFESLADISHPFETLPDKVQVSSSSDQKVLTSVQRFPGEPVRAFYGLTSARRNLEATALAQWRLRQHPEDTKMLEAYVEAIQSTNELAGIEDFLRSGLTNRPVLMEWHRAYQEVCRRRSGLGNLTGEYDQFLKADPTNSALLYLRGRLCEERACGTDYFKRAQQADSSNPYPLFAMAYDKAADGDWEGAMPLLELAVGLKPDEEGFRNHWELASLALQRFDAVEKFRNEKLKHEAADVHSAIQLLGVLAAEGKRKEAEKLIIDVTRAIRSRYPESVDEIRALLQNYFYYAIGDFSSLEKATRADKSRGAKEFSEGAKAFHFYALIEQNRLEEAAAIRSVADIQDPAARLGVSLAWRMAGKLDEAGRWQAAAIQALQDGRKASRLAVEMLEGKTAPTPAALSEVVIDPRLKAVLLADLALTHAENRDELKAAARRLNAQRTFPWHLVQRATADSP